MMDVRTKRIKRQLRHRRTRAKIKGMADRPRLCAFRSNKYLYVQLIDDVNQRTLIGLSSLSLVKPSKSGEGSGRNDRVAMAGRMGLLTGEKILKLGYNKIVFDKGGYKYHGQIKALADGIRKAGIEF